MLGLSPHITWPTHYKDDHETWRVHRSWACPHTSHGPHITRTTMKLGMSIDPGPVPRQHTSISPHITRIVMKHGRPGDPGPVPPHCIALPTHCKDNHRTWCSRPVRTHPITHPPIQDDVTWHPKPARAFPQHDITLPGLCKDYC